MKYVKIYDEKMQCLGVADIEQNYDKDGYVKLFDATTMKFRGVVDVDDIPESGDNMPVVKVFDENMLPCGVVTADNIRHSDGYLIRLQKDPSTTGAVTGGGRFIAGTSVTVVATPDAQSEYPEFDGWYEGETKVSENASYTFTVSGTRTLVAKFREVSGPTAIDLGLPSGTKWANYNVGATSETEYGNYYQYGKGAAQYAATSGDSLYSGTEDPLDSSVDTAVQVWGGSWHMPTREQMQELIANTTYEWTTINGVNGGKFTATNGNYVFFPAAGYYWHDVSEGVGDYGSYWGSSPEGSGYAFSMSFNHSSRSVGETSREGGYLVRPVQ